MKKRLLELMACRGCGGDFELKIGTQDADGEIVAGTISCPRCARSYPILRGVPRFLDGIRSEEDLRKVYADSFGHQWTTYNWLRDEDGFEFWQITDLEQKQIEGKRVFDAGCGGGRFARIVAPLAGEFVGLDYSIAVDKAYELCRKYPNAHFVQCDVNEHPFKPGLFDLVYSHGVLHHTPDTRRSFDQLPRLVKQGGILYVALFRQAFAPLRASDQLWRSLFNKLPIAAMDKVCGALSYLSYLPRPAFWKRFFWFSMYKTHELRKCCNYDWYAPRYHHEHTVEEVQGWFEAHGFAQPKYIDAWPYVPAERKYRVPTFWDSFRIGQLLGVIGAKSADLPKSASSTTPPARMASSAR